MGKAASVAMSRPAVVGGATCHKIGKGITYYVRDPAPPPGSAPPPGPARPLLLLMPWLGAQPQALSKYFQAYSGTSQDVLVVETGISQFLWPRWSLDYGAEVLQVLESDRFASRPLLVHCFSVGGYTFCQMLVCLSRDARRYRRFVDRVKGHVYDSLVVGSAERMAVGVGKVIVPHWEGLVRRIILLYLSVFKRYTVDIFDPAIKLFWSCPIAAPALFFFCEDDVMCDVGGLEELIECWRRRGVAVQSRKWAESMHAGHLRRHPEEYRAALDNFLLSLSTTPLKAKM